MYSTAFEFLFLRVGGHYDGCVLRSFVLYSLFDSTIENSNFSSCFPQRDLISIGCRELNPWPVVAVVFAIPLCYTPNPIYCIWTHVPYKNVHCAPITATCQSTSAPQLESPLLRTAIVVLNIWLFPLNCWPINLQKKRCRRPFWRI